MLRGQGGGRKQGLGAWSSRGMLKGKGEKQTTHVGPLQSSLGLCRRARTE